MVTRQWTEADVPDLTGRTALVTGANGGLGLRASQGLAAKGAQVLMACRNPSKAAAALDEVRSVAAPTARVDTVPLDLADLASVAACAEQVSASVERLDVLVNNAGVMALPYRRTADGFEMQLGTNHLGHFALTGRLLPVLLAASRPRVVTVSSQLHRAGRVRFDDLMGERRYNRWLAYGQSKLANLLFTAELARRAERAGSALVALAAHPGYASTHLQTAGVEMEGRTAWSRTFHLGNRLLAQTDVAGARPLLFAATMPDVAPGDYYGPDRFAEMRGNPKLVTGNRRSRDASVAARLWSVSEQLTRVTYDFS